MIWDNWDICSASWSILALFWDGFLFGSERLETVIVSRDFCEFADFAKKNHLCSKSLSKELDDRFDGKHPYNAMFGSLFSTPHYTLRGDGWDFYVTSKIHVVRGKTASMKFAGFSFANWVMADGFNAVFGHIFLGLVSTHRSNLSRFI